MVSVLYQFLLGLLRAVYKWFLHVFTGKSELERILDGAGSLGAACFQTEYALSNSRSPLLRNLLTDSTGADVDDLVRVLIKFKCIDSKIANRIRPKLTIILRRLVAYHQLKREVELLRRVKYDQGNAAHESLLLRVWDYLQPDTPLTSRVSKQWQIVGFQGDNPSTDFRGMGLLGLVQLIYFCEQHSKLCRRIFERSFHPMLGYPFAIASINFTALTRQLLQQDAFRFHFYNAAGAAHPSMDDFHDLYSCIFAMFDRLWFEEKPREGVMAFNSTKDGLFDRLVSHCSQNRVDVELYLDLEVD